MLKRVVALIATVAMTAVLGSCAAAPGTSPSALRVGEAGATPSPSSVACPQIDEAPLPPECMPYDPQALMDANERYRQRLPVDPQSFAAFEADRAEITAAMERLQRDERLSPEAVRQVLIDAGYQHETREGVNAWEKDGEIVFNGVPPAGGCVFGTVSETLFVIEVRGGIMDGGCHEAFTH